MCSLGAMSTAEKLIVKVRKENVEKGNSWRNGGEETEFIDI